MHRFASFGRTPRGRFLSATILTLSLCGASSALAQDADIRRTRLSGSNEAIGLRTAAMGNAFHGGGTGAGAIYANPAGVGLAAIYSFEAGYQHSTRGGTNAVTAAIVDSKTNRALSAAVGYSFAWSDGETAADDDNVRDHDLRPVIAFPVSNRFGLGLGGHAIIRSRGSYVNAESSREDLTERGFTMSAGAMAMLSDNLALGVTVDNLLTNELFDDIQRGLSAGAGVYVGGLHLEAQYTGSYTPSLKDESGTILRGGSFGHGGNVGAEYIIEGVPLRVGYELDPQTGDSSIGAGAGYRDERFGVDATYTQNLTFQDEDGDRSDRRFGVSASFFF